MKQIIEKLIRESISSINKDNSITPELLNNIRVDRTKDRAHGDFASNIAMMLAKPLKKNPRQIAQDIIDNICMVPDDNALDIVSKVHYNHIDYE